MKGNQWGGISQRQKGKNQWGSWLTIQPVCRSPPFNQPAAKRSPVLTGSYWVYIIYLVVDYAITNNKQVEEGSKKKKGKDFSCGYRNEEMRCLVVLWVSMKIDSCRIAGESGHGEMTGAEPIMLRVLCSSCRLEFVCPTGRTWFMTRFYSNRTRRRGRRVWKTI